MNGQGAYVYAVQVSPSIILWSAVDIRPGSWNIPKCKQTQKEAYQRSVYFQNARRRPQTLSKNEVAHPCKRFTLGQDCQETSLAIRLIRPRKRTSCAIGYSSYHQKRATCCAKWRPCVKPTTASATRGRCEDEAKRWATTFQHVGTRGIGT